MNKLDRLAKLQALHASGALSDDEFQAQKRALLQGSTIRWLIVAILVAAIMLGGFLWLRSMNPKPTAAQVISTSGASAPTANDNSSDQQLGRLPGGATGKLALLMKPDLLGGTLSYWESIAGPAKQVVGTHRVYTVDGCDVDIDLAGKVIHSIGMKITPSCTFDLSPFFADDGGSGLGQANALTVGKLGNRGPSFSSDCLVMCGNAVDPSVYVSTTGSHADNFHSLVAEITLNNDRAIAAANQWVAAMGGPEAAFVKNGDYNCEDKFNSVAASSFANSKLDHVTVVDGEPRSICDEMRE